MIENREGKKVPQVTFHTRRNHEWVDVTTDEIFWGQNGGGVLTAGSVYPNLLIYTRAAL